ncbi:Nuclear cap-binding protein subunit 1 [Elsinoe australis]|uniref:Nuclear cap-binding protein subunit 1 n=1 Tax=Elsinoe australis TaxID=40998 RepID=A0A2P8A2X0_9PEZI|nr:Nuclear cap-binding protein subunit 1 [Elsinoe australis]
MKTTVVLSLVASALAAPLQIRDAAPPGIPAASTAQTQLNGLTVRATGSSSGYSRDLFPHWSTVSGACNTREVVLARDGTNVVQSASSCAATSGTWRSPYDGATWTDAADVDIDHMVPLANAWRSGASSWTTARRETFANDRTSPQLWAVTDNVNQQKSDQSPDTWLPPLASFHCTYARSWIAVKNKYDLSITSAEKTALQTALNKC